MSDQQLFNRLKQNLLLKGLPGSYVLRMIDELKDHKLNLKNGESISSEEAEQRLGDVDELTKSICEKMKNATFFGRHTKFSYMCMPVIVILLGFGAVGIVFNGIISLIEMYYGVAIDEDLAVQNRVAPLFLGFVYIVKYMVPAIVAALFCYYSRKTFCGFKWALIACVTLTVIVLPFFVELKMPDPEILGSGMLSVGIGFPIDENMNIAISIIPGYIKGFFTGNFWHFIPICMFGLYYLMSVFSYKRSCNP